jgi:hypothetical protein
MNEDELGQLINLARSSQNPHERTEAVKRLGNGNYIAEDSDRILAALEQVILYDEDRALRNLAGRFYSKIVEKLENND